jgi:hypothetical protein
MICYLDRTFCPFHEGCKDGGKCPKALTDDIKEGAARWWGSKSAPVAVFMNPPGCFKEFDKQDK